ncbi:hypothetical protein Sjap_022383 [Stephania japonica]|uniref:Uncharacterized protein n=1 Tax=Stephania japonica TaxID=461633 RepID=A0AAP0HUD5_9MAGN
MHTSGQNATSDVYSGHRRRAETVLLATLIFLIVLIVVSHEIISIEGRIFKESRSSEKTECKKCVILRAKKEHSIGGILAKEHSMERVGGILAREASSLKRQQEDYRPTNPGHSPGIGH